VAALCLSTGVLLVEFVGGLAAGSLALLADAGHVLTDVVALSLSLLAVQAGTRPPSARRTFGYARLEILAAAANALVLLVVAGGVAVSTLVRWRHPPEVAGGLMLAVALVALVANGVAAVLLARAAAHSLTIRSAYLEVLGDLAGSATVVVAAVVVTATGWVQADLLAALVVAALIVPRTVSLLREASEVLLEGTPRGVDLDVVRSHILDVDGVVGVHDLHAWTITSGLPVLSAHVVVDDVTLRAGGSGQVLDRLGECLQGHFAVEHCTFQLEPPGHADHEGAAHP